MTERFDLIIVGAGPAGIAAAVTAAEGGARVAIIDQTSASAILGLAGPRAEEILQGASRAALPQIGRFRMAEAEIGYARAMAGRLSYTGEPGFELVTQTAQQGDDQGVVMHGVADQKL